jgi:hypothetical protein
MEATMRPGAPEAPVPVTPLVTCDAHGVYRVDPDSLAWLREQKAPLGVLACAGKYRTGKSYLMNRLCGAPRGTGFHVGETVQACTKGIWLHRKVLQGEHCAYVAIDTEGIDALDAENGHDVRIFTLGLLLSSLFLYNSVGAIDESSLQTLALMAKVSECVRVTADSSASIGELAPYFPHFMWVLRDFTLRLEDRRGAALSDAAYLEDALGEREGASAERGAVRAHLREAFPRRSLFTLPRPAADEHLQKLESTPRHAHPAFSAKLLALRGVVAGSIRPVEADGATLTGPMLAALCEHLVAGIDAATGRVPVIRDAWSLMSEVRARESKDAAVAAMRLAVASAPVRSAAALRAALEHERARLLAAFDAEQLQSEPALRGALEAELGAAVAEAAAHAHARVADRVAARVGEVRDRLAAALDLEEAEALLTRLCEAAEDEWGDDAEALEAWRGAAFRRMAWEWLPSLLARARAATASVAAEARAAEQRARALLAEAEVARGRHSGQLEEARGAGRVDVARLEEQLTFAERALGEGRECAAALAAERRELVSQLERLGATGGEREAAGGQGGDGAGDAPVPVPVAVAVAVAGERVGGEGQGEVEGAADGQGAEEATDEAGAKADGADRVSALERELKEARERQCVVEAEVAELSAIRTALLGQVRDARRHDEQQAARWSAELQVVAGENERVVTESKARAQREVAEARRELRDHLDEARRVAAEGATLRLTCAALDARVEEMELSFAREQTHSGTSDERARANYTELQDRLVGMHRAALEEARAREAAQRGEQERRSRELVELHARCSTALVEAEQARSENQDLKRKAVCAGDRDRDLKRATQQHAEAQARDAKAQVELRELRLRREEAVREREELRAQLLDRERALAMATRELQLERARLRV